MRNTTQTGDRILRMLDSELPMCCPGVEQQVRRLMVDIPAVEPASRALFGLGSTHIGSPMATVTSPSWLSSAAISAPLKPAPTTRLLPTKGSR